METDASDEGLGAVLSQEGESGYRLVTYHSRALNHAERYVCDPRTTVGSDMGYAVSQQPED